MTRSDELPTSKAFSELKHAVIKLFPRPKDQAVELNELARVYRRLSLTQGDAAADATMKDIAARYRELFRRRHPRTARRLWQ